MRSRRHVCAGACVRPPKALHHMPNGQRVPVGCHPSACVSVQCHTRASWCTCVDQRVVPTSGGFTCHWMQVAFARSYVNVCKARAVWYPLCGLCRLDRAHGPPPASMRQAVQAGPSREGRLHDCGRLYCDCGGVRQASSAALRCGCIVAEQSSKSLQVHGMGRSLSLPLQLCRPLRHGFEVAPCSAGWLRPRSFVGAPWSTGCRFKQLNRAAVALQAPQHSTRHEPAPGQPCKQQLSASCLILFVFASSRTYQPTN